MEIPVRTSMACPRDGTRGREELLSLRHKTSLRELMQALNACHKSTSFDNQTEREKLYASNSGRF
jgi:predicted ABC-type ATPase